MAEWTVGQEVIIRRYGRSAGDDAAVVSRVGRKYVYARVLDEGEPFGRERQFWIEDGQAVEVSSFDPPDVLGTPEMFAQQDRDDALRDAVRTAGWAPRGYRAMPIEQWRAVAAALGIEDDRG